ncbi:hypothetical protein JHK85_001095 [Glycine max]|nr:hypothetical protein JHK85_001095 [Glycine max]KAG5088451.1 hypothetical protein JHK86_001063 [Glycine max]
MRKVKLTTKEMSQSFDMIGAIDDNKESFKLVVWIVDRWFVQVREKSRHLEMVLMDGRFKSFEDIANGNYDPTMLIGELVSLLFNGQIFGCTLWSDHATKFMFWFKENLDLSPIVIILTLARVKMPQVTHGLTISNSLYGSKLLINYEVLNFAIYIERLSFVCLGEPSNVNQSFSIRQSSQGSDFSELDHFLYKSKILSISYVHDVANGGDHALP